MTSVTAALRANVARLTGTLSGRRTHTFTGSATGTPTLNGSLTYLHPRAVAVNVLTGRTRLVGRLAGSVTDPFGAFTDFAHYGAGLPDPAMVLIRGASAGLTTYDSSQPSNMRRLWLTVAGAADYPVSSGYAWRRSAYASVGVRINQMTANSYQFIDGAQVEMTSNAATGPSAYSPARSLRCNVRPNRLNFVANPNFENGWTGWTSAGGATALIDTAQHWAGAQSLKVTFPSSAPTGGSLHTETTTVSGLIPGRDYIFSVWVRVSDGCGNVRPYTDGTVQSFTDYAHGTQQGEWRRIWVTYTATSSSHFVGVEMAQSDKTQTTSPNVFWIDAALNEEGVALQDYFDGSYGDDYLWEQGGSANGARSYYYRDRAARGYLLQQLLDENSPLGIIPAVPQYAILPTD